MHLLITSDTVGGVWTYTQELVTGLAHGGHRVTLVSFGRLPLPHQTTWIENLPEVDYRPTEYRLEWMEVCERDIEESRNYLRLLAEEIAPDLLHLSQYCYGDIPLQIPKIVVAHSDLVSWWVAVHGVEPDDTPWIRRYRERVSSGLSHADMVIAPSRWMLDALLQHYPRPQQSRVIHNGRTAGAFDPDRAKKEFILTVGRLWDAAKQVSLLYRRQLPWPASIVGWQEEPGKETGGALPADREDLEFLPPQSQRELRELYARAAVYAATSRYEPFGLSPLEAAFSRCTLVANDNPVFHELWGEAALYFKKDDVDDLCRLLQQLAGDRYMREEYGERALNRARQAFTAEQMVEQYEGIYQEICSPAGVE
ncbi:MAG: glycosyltransferase family 4 protein [Acidobacteria bacterium]|nr:glycosyltransferase family 4 protein [Acidobacteriota bacterium]